MLVSQKIELSYFSLQLLEFISQNHPHLSEDYDFIKMRGDEAAEMFELSLSDNHTQSEALEFAYDYLYRGLNFSLHNLIRDVLWDELSEHIPNRYAEFATQKLYPKLKHLYNVDINEANLGHFESVEAENLDEDALRESVIAEIKKMIAEGYGI